MGILEERLQMINWIESGNRRKDFNKEFEQYINGFYDDYSYIDEYSTNSHCDLMNRALDLGIDVSSRHLSIGDLNKIQRYNRER